MKNDLEMISLNEIGAKYPILLIDTSSLVCPLSSLRIKHDDNLSLRNFGLDIEEESICLFFNYFDANENLFITEGIANEYGNRGSVKKFIKSQGDYGNRRDYLNYLRRVNSCNKVRNKLINFFYEKHKVIRLNDREKSLYENLKIQNIHIKAKRELKDTGFDFLITGAILLKFRGDVALISNNYHIVDGWNDLYDEGEIGENIDFFVRQNHNLFKKLIHSCCLHKRK